MDCPKCGYTLAPFEKECSRCQRIAHEEFLRSPAAVWPPAIGPAPADPPLPFPAAPKVYAPRPAHFEDTSEQNSSGEERGCPLEVAELHWNWGAFWCGWLWCFLNGLPGLAVLVLGAIALFLFFSVSILPAGYALPSELMALVLFGLHCHLGLRGHTLAWERRRFYGGMTQYFAVQRAWAIGGLIAFGLAATVMAISTVLFLKAFRAYEARRQHVAPPAAPAAPRGPAPVIMRAAPSVTPGQPIDRQPISGQPIYGQQGLRHPWEPADRFSPSGPMRPQFRPGPGPGNAPNPPDATGGAPAPPSDPNSIPAPTQMPAPNTVPGPGGYSAPTGDAPPASEPPASPTNPPPAAPITSSPEAPSAPSTGAPPP